MRPEEFISQLNYNFKQIHDECRFHEKAVQSSFLCGCFYCISTFYPTEIKDWHKDSQGVRERTAICPKCGIDSVLPTSELYEINDDLLKAMKIFYF